MITLLVPSIASAICFEWPDYPPAAEIDGFRLLMDSHSNVVTDIPADAREACAEVPDDGLNHNFFLVAYRGDSISDNSDIILIQQKLIDPPPAPQAPKRVGGFTIKVEIIQD